MQSLERESGDGRGGRASLGPGESLLVGVSSPGRWEAVREAEHCHYVHKGPWSQRPERQAWRPEGLGRAGAVGQEKGARSPPRTGWEEWVDAGDIREGEPSTSDGRLSFGVRGAGGPAQPAWLCGVCTEKPAGVVAITSTRKRATTADPESPVMTECVSVSVLGEGKLIPLPVK